MKLIVRSTVFNTVLKVTFFLSVQLFSEAFTLYSSSSSSAWLQKAWSSSGLFGGPWQHGTMGRLLPLRVLLQQFSSSTLTRSSRSLKANHSSRSSSCSSSSSLLKPSAWHWPQHPSEAQARPATTPPQTPPSAPTQADQQPQLLPQLHLLLLRAAGSSVCQEPCGETARSHSAAPTVSLLRRNMRL